MIIVGSVCILQARAYIFRNAIQKIQSSPEINDFLFRLSSTFRWCQWNSMEFYFNCVCSQLHWDNNALWMKKDADIIRKYIWFQVFSWNNLETIRNNFGETDLKVKCERLLWPLTSNNKKKYSTPFPHSSEAELFQKQNAGQFSLDLQPRLSIYPLKLCKCLHNNVLSHHQDLTDIAFEYTNTFNASIFSIHFHTDNSITGWLSCLVAQCAQLNR